MPDEKLEHGSRHSYYEEKRERERRKREDRRIVNVKRNTAKPTKIMGEQATKEEYLPVPAIYMSSFLNDESSHSPLDTAIPGSSKLTAQFYVPRIELQNILECQKADIKVNTTIPERVWRLNLPEIELPKFHVNSHLPSADESLEIQKTMTIEVPKITSYQLYYEEENSISTGIPKIVTREPKIPEIILRTLKIISKENLEADIPVNRWGAKIPQLIMGELKVTPYGNVDLSFPKTERKQLDIPKFRFSTPQLMFLNEKLELRYSTGVRTERLLIPRLKFRRPVIEFLEEKLDCSMIKGKVLRVPELKLKQELNAVPTEVKINSTVSSKLMGSVKAELSPKHVQGLYEEVLEREKVTPQEKTGTMASSEFGGGKDFELEDPFEKLFGNGAGKVRDVEPLVILFKDYENDSYIQTFEVLLYRLYREKAGGKPSVKSLSLRKAWSIKEIEQWLDEGKSVKKIKFDKEREDLDMTELANRLDAMFSEGAGIVILYAKNEKEFEEIESKICDICTILEGKPDIIKVKAPKLSLQEKIKLAQLLFGNVIISEDDLSRASATNKEVIISNGKPVIEVPMDTVLNIAMKKYKQKLERIWSKYPFLIKRNIDEESPEHIMGKAFIAYTLVKKLEKSRMIPKEDKKKNWDKIRKEWILSEIEIPGTAIRPDITFKDLGKEEYYEFETLFEEGFLKIYEKLDKYDEYNLPVNIVVEPITALLHANDNSANNFATLIAMIKNGQIYGNLKGKVGFYTLDLKNKKLIPIEDYLKELKTWLSKVGKIRKI